MSFKEYLLVRKKKAHEIRMDDKFQYLKKNEKNGLTSLFLDFVFNASFYFSF